LLPGPLGAPAWPEGCIGTITHDDGLCAAAAGPVQAAAGIGIDLCAAERRDGLPELLPLLLADGEREACRLAADPVAHLHRLFCVKEAVVKAASAHAGRFFDLREIHVTLHDGERFDAAVPGLALHLAGHHAAIGGHALALATLPPAAGASGREAGRGA
jgi:4'-phosphopantetheinyl transferase EntD